ncbi:polygalacturonase 1 beta-like protein 3 [Cynara cardunculus var. scolymus]|uniref:BURP domain-containing protein n=1 Tax=Cynara cardunculus var. scolymus TaxID=59895 RepID=A0A103YAS3_CYNCS|nr:polygalacturonase 1 beta-like protein 3 [Cynara cardunculus var. scolymus]KVI05637.1 BURP domain-containing protein [Cynara cardunculus var. scolymus]
MHKFKNFIPFLILIFSSINVLVFAGKPEDPFTPRGYIIRYWRKQISNDKPKPSFLIEKASPLTAVQSAAFSKLADDQNSLATNLPSFCSAANLLCFPDVGPSLEKHSGDVNFIEYSEKNFTNYGSGRLGGLDSFKNYSNDGNSALDSFRRYSRDSVGHDDKFSTYAKNTNVPDQSFNTYGTKATGGTGDFTGYAEDVNVPNMRFSSYSDDVNGRDQKFTSYSQDANAGDQSFTSYGKKGNGAVNDFKGYGNNSNVIGSSFSGYGENGNGANDSFTSYGENGNVPQNNFKSYADGGNAAVDTFANYRDQSNVGDDNFKSYAKSSNAANMKFSNYGKSFNEGTDTFSGYGGGTVTNQKFGFKGYGVNNTFKDYADKKRASFSTYATKPTAAQLAAMKTKSPASGKPVNKWIEPGKFFRESLLKSGTIIPMPDIRDKMPKRSFLPRVIVSKLPFSSSKIDDLKKIFHAEDNSSMASLISNSLSECERKPSQGESKRCVGSVEDMIDFATSVLGRDVVVRTTDNINGSGKKVKIGSVTKINGGKVTKSVSCHQSLFPYMLYYCHSVPKVRVYEADLLDPSTTNSKKINHGVAICHLDTSAWSPTHGAFLSLGSKPGKIEVCHWIFENDMTWAVAD